MALSYTPSGSPRERKTLDVYQVRPSRNTYSPPRSVLHSAPLGSSRGRPSTVWVGGTDLLLLRFHPGAGREGSRRVPRSSYRDSTTDSRGSETGEGGRVRREGSQSPSRHWIRLDPVEEGPVGVEGRDAPVRRRRTRDPEGAHETRPRRRPSANPIPTSRPSPGPESTQGSTQVCVPRPGTDPIVSSKTGVSEKDPALRGGKTRVLRSHPCPRRCTLLCRDPVESSSPTFLYFPYLF